MILERKQAPVIVDAVDFNLQLKPYEKFILRNGVEVYTINAGAEDVISLEWVFFAGNSFEDQNLVAATTNFLLKNGTLQKTAFQINEYFEYFGAFLNRSCQNETASISLHCLTKHVAELLPVVKELINESTMPQDELDTYKQNMKQRLKVNLKKSDFIANRLIDVYLYGENHPYGKFSSAEAIDSVGREQLLDFYKKYYQQGKLIMFVAGKLHSGLEKLLDNNFGDLPNNSININNIPLTPASEKKFRIINDPNGVQGSIRLARLFPNRHHPDFLKTQVLNNLFGGFFGSRLMLNIREDKGYTYGIHSGLQNHIHQSAWMISTEAGKDVCEATITEVFKEMKRLQDEPVGKEELLLVQNYMIGGILGDLDGPFHIIGRWKNIILNNLDPHYFYNSVNTIKNISSEAIQELAQKYLHSEEFYELIVV